MSLNEDKQVVEISPKLPWLAAMAMFMQSLDATILNTALPTIAADLKHSPLAMQGVVVSYALTLALLIPMSGWLSDKYGTKRIFSIALFLFTLGSLTCAISTTFTELVLSRILQAIGGSMMVPVSRLALIYAYPKSKLLQVMNFVTMPGLVGPVVGPLLGGWLVDVASWHWIFLINIPIGVIGLIFTQKIMPNFTRTGKSFDLIGFVLFGGALISLSLGLELNESSFFNTTSIFIIITVSIALIVMYIFYAKRVSNPLINLGLFKIRTLRVGLLGNLFTRLGIGSVPFLLPQMIQIAFLHTPTGSGTILMASAISTIAAKSAVIPLVHRFGYKNILITNTIILAGVISMFALPDKTTPLYMLIPLLAIYGAVNSIQMSAMNTIALADLTPEVASGGNSLLAITQQLSMSFGVSVGALILRGIESSYWLSKGDISFSFRATFIVLGIITVFASSIFLFLRKEDGSLMSGHK
jgi:EmrB/QacA subfamily drug resistance transporter